MVGCLTWVYIFDFRRYCIRNIIAVLQPVFSPLFIRVVKLHLFVCSADDLSSPTISFGSRCPEIRFIDILLCEMYIIRLEHKLIFIKHRCGDNDIEQNLFRVHV